MLVFNQKEVLNVIKILRGNNDVDNNCTHVSSDLIDYFKTGMIPSAESSINPSTSEDFNVLTVSNWIKKENGSKYLGMIKSIVCLNNTKITDIPCNITYKQLDDGTLDLNNDIYDVDNFTQHTSSVTEINNCLKMLSKENEQGVSFGFICIGRCGKYIDTAGHMLVYFANYKDIYYIDCQLYNGIDKINNGCIFSDLSLTYEFANKSKIHVDVFGEYVFYIPIGPKIIRCMDIIPIKLEITENNDLNKEEKIKIKREFKKCSHGKSKYICIECGGSQICLHNKRKSRCKECKGSETKQCKHDKTKNHCKICNTSRYCLHGRSKYKCIDCKGPNICQHNKIKTRCPDCKNSKTELCDHNVLKYKCVPCKGAYICKHDKRKNRCKECNPSKIKNVKSKSSNSEKFPNIKRCPHDKRKDKCKECGGSGMCKHGKQKFRCNECNGVAICSHGRRKYDCKNCKNERLESSYNNVSSKKLKINNENNYVKITNENDNI